MLSLVTETNSILDETGAIKGINVTLSSVITDTEWYPPSQYISHDLPFPTDLLRVREKGTTFEGLYHREKGLVLPCIWPSIKVLNITDRILSVSRPKSPLNNLVCGVTGRLLFAGYVHLRVVHGSDNNPTQYLIKIRNGKKGHTMCKVLSFTSDTPRKFERVFTRVV